MPTNAERRAANQRRRELAAAKQRPLPMRTPKGTGQLDRAERNAAAKAERYPYPPVYDQLADVRGDPTIRGNPQPIFRPRFRSGLGVFDVLRTVRSVIVARTQSLEAR